MQMSRKIIVAFRHRQTRGCLNFTLYVTEHAATRLRLSPISASEGKDRTIILSSVADVIARGNRVCLSNPPELMSSSLTVLESETRCAASARLVCRMPAGSSGVVSENRQVVITNSAALAERDLSVRETFAER